MRPVVLHHGHAAVPARRWWLDVEDEHAVDGAVRDLYGGVGVPGEEVVLGGAKAELATVEIEVERAHAVSVCRVVLRQEALI